MIKEELAVSIEFDLEDVGPERSVLEVGNLCEQIAYSYRSLAICNLLWDGDTDEYYHNLIRSAQIKLNYLHRCHNENFVDNPRLIASSNESFFDAVAAGQFDLAKKIGDLCAAEWDSDYEYADDYYYSSFLFQFVNFDDSVRNKLNQIIRGLSEALDGEDSSRFDICKAFLDGDQDCFDDAFNRFLDERVAQIEKDEKTGIGEEMTFQIERHVSIEGLGILRIAKKMGFVFENEYLFCPSIALVPMERNFLDDRYPFYIL